MTPADIDTRLAQARERGLRALDEPVGKEILAAVGIDVPASRVLGIDDDVAQAIASLAPPYALKVISPAVVHKSEVGGVRLGLRDHDEVAAAMASMRVDLRVRRIDPAGWLVEEMAPAGVEVVVGGATDPEFGPVVMVGLGGIFVEVLKDVAFRICPIELIDANEMIDELRGVALLRGVRGREPVAVDAIVDVVVRLGGQQGVLLRYERDVTEVDINPLIVTRDRAIAVDARFVLRPRAS